MNHSLLSLVVCSETCTCPSIWSPWTRWAMIANAGDESCSGWDSERTGSWKCIGGMRRLFEKKTSAALEAEACSPLSWCAKEEAEEEEDEDEDAGATWVHQLSGSERWRFQLARAFVHDPHVLLVHRPADELDPGLQETVLGCFRDFVDKRGLEIDDSSRQWLSFEQRRPKTVIFTTGSSTQIAIADYIWRIGKGGLVIEKPTRTPTGPVQSLQFMPQQ
mmetsp:Transcript_7898/g.18146  ORF Transcript_7898/g.18146 Transcript_7898/m.18146 type:complete len:219 (+) Transcript_7898:1950-2606(+)